MLRARLKTIGVSEYKFEMEAGDQGTQWRIVDVGGSRFQVRCMPLACLMFHAADNPTVAAYVAPSFRPVVAVSYMIPFFLSHWWT